MKNEHTKKQVGFDAYLLEKIQAQGGISFKDESVIKTGNGYETCVHIYEFPKKSTPNWLRTVCNIKDTITTVDISTDDINEVKKNINRSLKEQNTRFNQAVNFEESFDAAQRTKELQTLYKEIDSMGEVIKLISIRIFLSDKNWIALQEKIKKLSAILESNGYRPTIYLNETKNEWISVYQTYTKQQANPFAVLGQSITTKALAIGNPFHFVSLEDPEGSYLGYSTTGGNILFDEFTKTKNRLYYNSLVIGTMGSGKSTLLKKRFEDRAARGDFIRAFDIANEFTTLTKAKGGRIINLDGSGGILNPLEILRAGENETTNFQRHISKVTTIYKFLVPTAEHQEITFFTNIIRELYDKFGLNPDLDSKETQITGLPPASYPIFSDLLQFIQDKMKTISSGKYNEIQKQVAINQIVMLEKIRNTVENIVKTYGTIFNGHTSIDRILDEQIVTFDISNLKEMDSGIFDAQIFNMVSLCWDNCVTNGTLMNKLYREGKIEKRDIVRFTMLIDESHRWINTQKPQALDLITIYMREARKFNGSIMLASQNIRDYMPDGSDDEKINKLKTVFELTQYKFIFHQESSALPKLKDVFQNEMTGSQINMIPKLEMGDCILCISGEKNIQFHVYLSKEEERLFTGGI